MMYSSFSFGPLPSITAATLRVSSCRTFAGMCPRTCIPSSIGRKSARSLAFSRSSTFLPASPRNFSPAARVIQPANSNALNLNRATGLLYSGAHINAVQPINELIPCLLGKRDQVNGPRSGIDNRRASNTELRNRGAIDVRLRYRGRPGGLIKDTQFPERLGTGY